MPAPPVPTLLLTRTRAASRRVENALRAAGARFETVVSPAMEICFEGTLPDVTDLRGLVFTSANGVAAWCALGGPTDLHAYTVGTATAQAARSAGFSATHADGDADDLVADLVARKPEGPLCHVHGRFTRGSVSARLTQAGIPTRSAVLYDQRALPPNAQAKRLLGGTAPVVTPLYSPRSAEILGTWPIRAPLLVAAMSEAVVNSVPSHHIQRMRVAVRPTAEEMINCIATLLRDAMRLETEGRDV